MPFTSIERRRKKVAIVGGGFSGLGVAIALRSAGIDDFIILERGPQLGGTWRDNTYPGCACDVPSQFYSYSFAPKHDWSRSFAPQHEIQDYLLDIARRYDLEDHVELDTPCEEARWDEATRRWKIRAGSVHIEAEYLVACQGPLHEPFIPALPGLREFQGVTFHSARWRHDIDLRARRVAVVGTGSSAIQFVPEIQPRVARLYVFQRTPAWVLPKTDRPISKLQQLALRHLPGYRRGLRFALQGLTDALQWAQRDPARMRTVEPLARAWLRRQVPDPDLRERLTPRFTLGCKRVLLSNDWYPALQASNVELVGAGVTALSPGGIVGADRIERRVDVVIFGTGFRTADAAMPRHVFGVDGTSLAEAWRGSPEAYLGTTVHGFPNFFTLLGPNVGTGHGSAFTVIEAQANYVADVLRFARSTGVDRVEVRAEVQARWTQAVHRALAGTVWNAGGCNSWYVDGTGRNTTIYPWSTGDLRRRLRRFDPAHFRLSRAPASAHVR